MIGGLEILDEEPGQFLFAALLNVTIVVWVGAPDGPAMRRLERVGIDRAGRYPKRLSDVHVVLPSVRLPDAEARAFLAEGAKQGAPHLAAVAVWLCGDGFWASAVRSVVTGIQLLLRAPFELGFFGDGAELARWLSRVHHAGTGVLIAPDDLRLALEEALRRAQQRPL